MTQYEYGNLYVLRVTIEFGGGGGFGADFPFDGYLIETQGRRTAEYVGAWGEATVSVAGKEYKAPGLAIMNELGKQGWVIHPQVLVKAPGPAWMKDVFIAQVGILAFTGLIQDVWHEATHTMTRRIPVFGRRRSVSAERFSGVSPTPAPTGASTG